VRTYMKAISRWCLKSNRDAQHVGPFVTAADCASRHGVSLIVISGRTRQTGHDRKRLSLYRRFCRMQKRKLA
jgi:hypothetical protein